MPINLKKIQIFNREQKKGASNLSILAPQLIMKQNL